MTLQGFGKMKRTSCRIKSLPVQVQGEGLLLIGDRSLFWPDRETLIVADLHWGKSTAFRAASLAIPSVIESDLDRLTSTIRETGARRLLVLGDLLHSRRSREAEMFVAVENWRNRHTELEVILVRGNHDCRAGDPPPAWRFSCCDEPLTEKPFVFRHLPVECEDGYTIGGHLHPAVVLRSRGRQTLRLPCFLFGQRLAILPAYGTFTGSAKIRPQEGEKVYVVAEDQVLDIDAPLL